MSNLDKRLSDLERRAPRAGPMTITRPIIEPVYVGGTYSHREEVGTYSAGVYVEHSEPVRVV